MSQPRQIIDHNSVSIVRMGEILGEGKKRKCTRKLFVVRCADTTINNGILYVERWAEEISVNLKIIAERQLSGNVNIYVFFVVVGCNQGDLLDFLVSKRRIYLHIRQHHSPASFLD